MKMNKGEWAEFYAFLQILYNKQLQAADKYLNPIPDKFYVFSKVIKENGSKI